MFVLDSSTKHWLGFMLSAAKFCCLTPSCTVTTMKVAGVSGTNNTLPFGLNKQIWTRCLAPNDVTSYTELNKVPYQHDLKVSIKQWLQLPIRFCEYQSQSMILHIVPDSVVSQRFNISWTFMAICIGTCFVQHTYGIHISIWLSHWGLNKMDAISQTTFSNAFYLMKMCEFWLKLHWSLFPRVQLRVFQHWFRLWLGAMQATSHYLNQWWSAHRCKYVSFGLNELSVHH